MKETRLKAKSHYTKTHKEYRLARKQYATHRGPKPTARALFFKKQMDKAKVEQKIAKKAYKKAKKADDTYIPNRIKRRTKQSTKMKIRHDVEHAMRDNDILGDWVKTRQDIRQTRFQVNASKRALRNTNKLAKYTIKHGYGQLNRTYNFARGRGYTRTPKEFSWEGRLSKRLRQTRQRFSRSKVGKVSKGTGKVLKVTTKPIRSILANPLTIKSYFLMFLIFGVIALFMGVFGGSGPVQQDEFDLNKSWLQLSKRDREKSTDEVAYWTNIDDILYFMNYRYGSEWNPDSKWLEGTGGELAGNLGFNHYSDALNDLWNHLNDDPHNLKTMADIYGSKSKLKWAKLSKEELDDYQELLEMSEEVGLYPSYQELANPLYLTTDQKYSEPITISSRFGYTSKTDKQDYSTIEAAMDSTLYSVMAGTITIKEDGKEGTTPLYDITITSEDKDVKFTYENVKNVAVKDEQVVSEGDNIAKVASTSGQDVSYQKRHDDPEGKTDKKGNVKKVWTFLNVGFYFPAVTYSQKTEITVSVDFNTDATARAKEFVTTIKKFYPNATNEGLASMLANFDIESGITARRYETDFLTDNAFDKMAKDPTAETLVGGWGAFAALYDISLNKAGYLYQGKHWIGIGYGQWTGPRAFALWNYAAKKNQSIWSVALQAEFLAKGDAPYYTNVAKSILENKANASVDTLTVEFLTRWEGVPGNKQAQRVAAGQKWLKWLKDGMQVTSAPGAGIAAASHTFPAQYQGKLKYGQPPASTLTTLPGNYYPVGQCTWYVANRLITIGLGQQGLSSNNGNGQDWVGNLVAKGWKYSSKPVPGAVMSESGGTWGHVAFVEHVNPDGSFLVSECNYAGVQNQVHYRVITSVAPNMSFAYYK